MFLILSPEKGSFLYDVKNLTIKVTLLKKLKLYYIPKLAYMRLIFVYIQINDFQIWDVVFLL